MWDIYIHTHTHTHAHTHTQWNTYIYVCGILPGNQKEWNLAICNNMDGTRVYYAKLNWSVRERQISQDFTQMWSLRYKTDEHMGREGKIR